MSNKKPKIKEMKRNEFKTQNPIGPEDLPKLKYLLLCLRNDQKSAEFRYPVNYEALGLLDYPLIIKKPMDISTVSSNLKNGKYQYIEGCLNDIQLIWDNCMHFNAEGSWIYNLAEDLEIQSQKMISN